MIVRGLVWLIAAANVLWGVAALVAPAWAAGVLHLTPERASATGELRAVFGGLVIALGAATMLALADPARRDWLRPLALAFAGLATGRVVSLVADGVSTYTVVALAGEALTGVLLVTAARRS